MTQPRTITHPLLGGPSQPHGPAESRAWELGLEVATFPYLADHRIQGMLVLPGFVYVELALAAYAAVYGALPRSLEAIAFQQLCYLPEHGARQLQARLSAGGGAIRFEVTSEPADSEGATGPAHASISIPASPGGPAPYADQHQLAAIRARCTEPLPGAAFYAALHARGNQYGPAFQGIAQVWRGASEAIGLLRVPAALDREIEAYHLHPALLDSAIQALAAADWDVADTLVFTGMDRLILAGKPDAARWIYARLRPERSPGSLAGDVYLLDEAGRTVVALFGVQFTYLEYAPAPPHHYTIAVAATFTAEPLEEALAFWMDTLELPASITFAPYNQLFQQLLDPAGTLARNQDGANVILVRFEDWIARTPRLTPMVTPAEQARLLAGRPQHTLPNGLTIAHLNAYETGYLYDEIFLKRAYLKHGIVLRDGDCVIDVGANIGLFTLFVWQHCPHARMYAFEPSPPAFEALRTNARLYGPAAHVFNYGLSDTNRPAPLTFYRHSSVFSGFHTDTTHDQRAMRAIIRRALEGQPADPAELDSFADALSAERLDSETFLCQLRTLSSIIHEQQIDRIDLLKIDVEKSELEVLNGIAIEDWRIIRQIVIEVHDRAGSLIAAIASILKVRGFDIIVAAEDALGEAGLWTLYAKRADQANERPAAQAQTTPDAQLEQNVRDLAATLRAAQRRSRIPHLLCICPASPAATQDPALHARFERIERRLAVELADIPIVHLISAAEILGTYPVAQPYDPHGDELGHIPYTAGFFTALGTTIARKWCALRRNPYKVIALDCDGTLWQGVCGEDGPLGIAIDPPHAALQAFMVRQSEAGMLICLCSKNNQEDVLQVFEQRPDMPLRREHIAAWRINWEPKSKNLQSLANELQLGLESFLFIDDDPVTCAEVQAHCPDVAALPLPDRAEDIPDYLAHQWAFDRLPLTEADRQRTLLYRQNSAREAFRQTLPTFESFLASLALEVRIFSPAPHQLARVAQLTQRTNQFNCTTIRRSEAEIAGLLRSGALECLAVEAGDRFGDYGLIGTMLFKAAPETLVVDTFLLSCRALGKGIEHGMLARLGALGVERGLERVGMPYRPSGRNEPARTFLEGVARANTAPISVEHTGADEAAERDLLYTFPARSLAALTFTPDGAEESGSPEAGRPEAATPGLISRRNEAELLHRIAIDLRATERILAAIEAHRRRRRPRLNTSFTAPDTDVERAIAQVWEQVLGIDQVGLDDRFFEVGGTSLKAVLVIAQLRRMFDAELTTISLFDKTTIRALARMLRSPEDTADWEQKSAARHARGTLRRTQNLARMQRSRPKGTSQ